MAEATSANPEEEQETGATDEPTLNEQMEALAADGPAPNMGFTILRDLALIFALLTLWGAGDAWSQSSGLVLAGFVALGNAIFIGLALGAIFHEWGHYIGARASGGKVTLIAPRGLSIFRFMFDFEENDRRQFHWMTYGGWIAHWGIVILLALFIPLDTSNRVALISAAAAFAFFAMAIELPVIMDSMKGTDPQEALASNINRPAYIRSSVIGGVAGLFVYAFIT